MDRIDQLRAFVRIVEVQNFSLVASELRVSQPTVSKWLAALEDEIGVSLVDRSTRALSIRNEGQDFYIHAKQVLATFDDAVQSAQNSAQEIRGRIRISLPVVYGRRHLAPLIANFLRRYPEIEIEMLFNDRYVSLVEEGFDLAIRVGTQLDSSLTLHRLSDSSRYLVASPKYLRKHGTPKNPEALREHSCLVHTGLSGPTIWTFEKNSKSYRVPIRARIANNNSEVTAMMCKRGLGIALLASWLVDADLRSGRLRKLLPSFSTTPAPICALTPPGRRLSPRVRTLVEFLRKQLA